MEKERERVLSWLRMTHKGETVCLSYEQAKTLVDWITELTEKKGEKDHE